MGNTCKTCDNNLPTEMDNSLVMQNVLIKEMDFRVQAQTGDLILFRSLDLIAKMQRKLTKSEYDHVGIVIRI